MLSIRGIWLCREGNKTVVYVTLENGEERKVIEEVFSDNFSHYIHEHGIRRAPVTRRSDADIIREAITKAEGESCRTVL